MPLQIFREANRLIVEFKSSSLKAREIATEFVLDHNGFGDVVGIEILNLKYQAGPNVLEGCDQASLATEDANTSYDDDADAFYIKLIGNERSIDQVVAKGTLVLDHEGHLIRLEAILE